MPRPVAGALALIASLLLASSGSASSQAVLSSLAQYLRQQPTSLVRDFEGKPLALFGVPATEARMVFYPVTRERALPEGYRPGDLDRSAGRPVRRLILEDLRAMIANAAADDVELAVISGFRSPEEQQAAFESSVWVQFARSETALDEEEARNRAARFVAPPGHSQHQLGTAVDLSSWEVGYALQPRFAESEAGRWIARNGWAYGFVLPYTERGEARTQYAYEPWHLRWVGRQLAALMHADGYLEHPYLVVDDYMLALEEIMNAEGIW